MPQIGPLELLFVGILALIVFGPQKLPEMARTLGRALNELKRMASEVRSDFEMGLDDVGDEPDEPPPAKATSGTAKETATAAEGEPEAAATEGEPESPVAPEALSPGREGPS